MKEKYLKRIVDNEATVKELEMLYAHLKEELGSCKGYAITSQQARKYGLDRTSLISAILAQWEAINKNHEN